MTAPPSDPALICRMIFEELCVNANGDIVCSCADPSGRRVYGNVFRDRIAAVYDGAAYRATRAAQLAAEPSSFCPVIGTACGGRVTRASGSDRPAGRVVRLLQLEPVSECNLRCPGCPSTEMRHDPGYRDTPGTLLPLATMLDVVGQLPQLEKLLFYNFGEPFLHPEAIPFLREVRRRRPDVTIHTSTNGLPLSAERIEALGAGALVDRIVFSIDGAFEESYRRYRVKGSLERALRNLAALVDACERHGTRARVEIVWQYILFEWNDSDAELEAARARAAQLGVPLRWVITHTPGASRVYTDGSAATRRLFGSGDPYEGLTCDARMHHLWRYGGVAAGRYAARLEVDRPSFEGIAGSHQTALLRVENRSSSSWAGGTRLRVGARLRSATGRILRELQGVPLPEAALPGFGSGTVLIDLTLPEGRFEGDLFLDVVEEGVCWFSERSSAPLVVPVRTYPGTTAATDASGIVRRVFEKLLERPPEAQALAFWSARLRQGLPLEILMREIAAGSCSAPIWKAARMHDLRRNLRHATMSLAR